MKKLLSILGSLAMVSVTSTSVIACGKKPQVGVEMIDIAALTAKYGEKINEIVSARINETAQYFIGNGSTGSNVNENIFFNTENLEKMIESKEFDKTAMQDEFKKLVGFDTIVSEVESELRNSSEFTLLTSNLKEKIIRSGTIMGQTVKTGDDDEEFDEQSNFIVATSNKASGASLYKGFFKFNVRIDYAYYNPNTSSSEIANELYQFTYTIFNSDDFLGKVQNMLSNIKVDSIKDKDFANNVLNVTSDAFDRDQYQDLKATNGVGNVSYEYIRNWFKYDSYAGAQKSLADFWKQKYDMDLEDNGVSLNTESASTKFNWRVFMKDQKDLTISDINDLNSDTAIGKVVNSVWGVDHSNPETSYSAIASYTDLVWNDSVNAYKKSLKSFVQSEDIATDGYLDIDNSILAGTTLLSNLKLVDKDIVNGFSTDLPTIQLYISYKPAKKTDSVSLANGSYKEGFQKNIARTLQGFQELYNIDTTKRNGSLLGGFKNDDLYNSLPSSVSTVEEYQKLIDTFNLESSLEAISKKSNFDVKYTLKYFYGTMTTEHYFGYSGTTNLTFAKDDTGMYVSGFSNDATTNQFVYRLNIGYLSLSIHGKIDGSKINTSDNNRLYIIK